MSLSLEGFIDSGKVMFWLGTCIGLEANFKVMAERN